MFPKIKKKKHFAQLTIDFFHVSQTYPMMMSKLSNALAIRYHQFCEVYLLKKINKIA